MSCTILCKDWFADNFIIRIRKRMVLLLQEKNLNINILAFSVVIKLQSIYTFDFFLCYRIHRIQMSGEKTIL